MEVMKRMGIVGVGAPGVENGASGRMEQCNHNLRKKRDKKRAAETRPLKLPTRSTKRGNNSQKKSRFPPYAPHTSRFKPKSAYTRAVEAQNQGWTRPGT